MGETSTAELDGEPAGGEGAALTGTVGEAAASDEATGTSALFEDGDAAALPPDDPQKVIRRFT